MLKDIQLKIASHKEQAIISHLAQFYCYDLCQQSKYTKISLTENGLFEDLPYLNLYWKEPNRWPYLLMKDELPIGFTLVHNRPHAGIRLSKGHKPSWSVNLLV